MRCETWQIEKVETTCDKPGWIYKHKAALKNGSLIYISGGKVWKKIDDKEHHYLDQTEDYILDLKTLMWKHVQVDR